LEQFAAVGDKRPADHAATPAPTAVNSDRDGGYALTRAERTWLGIPTATIGPIIYLLLELACPRVVDYAVARSA
jgi:hypothetical protein